MFIHYLQEVTGWQEARHEAPIQRLRDVQNVTVTGHEWSNPLPNPRKQEPYDFILRALIAEANMKKRIVYDSEIASFAAMGTRQAANHLRLVSVLQTMRRQIRRKEEIYMQWTPGHSKHLGNEMADGLAFIGSQGTCFGPHWMKDAFKKVHRKATEIGIQHSGWSGFRDVLITAAEKVIGHGRQPVVGLPYSEESLKEFCLASTAATHLETRGRDQSVDIGNFADRVPNVPTNHRLAWLPDGQEIRATTCQMRDSAPSTDEITKTLIVASGEDAIYKCWNTNSGNRWLRTLRSACCTKVKVRAIFQIINVSSCSLPLV